MNQNTSMSEEAKVHHADEAIAIAQGGKTIRGKRKERLCKSFGT